MFVGVHDALGLWGNEYCTDGPPYGQLLHGYGLDKLSQLLS